MYSIPVGRVIYGSSFSIIPTNYTCNGPNSLEITLHLQFFWYSELYVIQRGVIVFQKCLHYCWCVDLCKTILNIIIMSNYCSLHSLYFGFRCYKKPAISTHGTSYLHKSCSFATMESQNLLPVSEVWVAFCSVHVTLIAGVVTLWMLLHRSLPYVVEYLLLALLFPTRLCQKWKKWV